MSDRPKDQGNARSHVAAQSSYLEGQIQSDLDERQKNSDRARKLELVTPALSVLGTIVGSIALSTDTADGKLPAVLSFLVALLGVGTLVVTSIRTRVTLRSLEKSSITSLGDIKDEALRDLIRSVNHEQKQFSRALRTGPSSVEGR